MSNIYAEATFETAIEHNLITEGGYIKTTPETFERKLYNLTLEEINTIEGFNEGETIWNRKKTINPK